MILCPVWAVVAAVEWVEDKWVQVEWVDLEWEEEVNHHQEPFKYLKMKWKQSNVCNS